MYVYVCAWSVGRRAGAHALIVGRLRVLGKLVADVLRPFVAHAAEGRLRAERTQSRNHATTQASKQTIEGRLRAEIRQSSNHAIKQ